MNEQIQPWCLFIEDERNYIFWWEQSLLDLTLLPLIKSWSFEYNQNEFSKDYWFCLCTAYAPIWVYSNNIKQDINEQNRLDIVKKRVSLKDFNKKIWWYLDKWVKCISDYFWDSVYYKIPKKQIKQFLDKWYYINIWMYAWWDLDKARNDWNISKDDIMNIVNTSYWHSTILKKVWDYYWHDNYAWVKKNNVSKIEDIDKFINSWVVYQNAYIIVPNKVIKKMFEDLLKTKNYKEAFDYYYKLSETLYNREKQILQYVLQNKYIWKINSEELKQLVF